MLLGLAFTLVAIGAAPAFGGLEVDAARRGKRSAPVSAEARLAPGMRQRFENTEVRLGIIDGVGTVATTSTIEVSGLTGPVLDVDVNLIGITHGPASTQDIDVLLIGPGGKTALILSDVGGNTATQNVSLVLDDQQPEQLPSATALTTGFYQPTNIGSPDTMNLGNGPFTPPSGSSLGAFNGIDPNGTWRLWVFDDQPNGSPQAGSGINGGWAVTITTANRAPAANPDRYQAKAGRTLHVKAAGVLRNDRDPDGDALTVVLDRAPRKGKAVLNANGSFTYKANRQARGHDSFTYVVRDGNGSTARAMVNIQIKPPKPNPNKGGRSGRR
jgi:hypothetical protein